MSKGKQRKSVRMPATKFAKLQKRLGKARTARALVRQQGRLKLP